LGYFYSQHFYFRYGIMMVQLNLQHQKKKSKTVGILLLSTPLLVLWDNDNRTNPRNQKSKLLG
jgi:hypothetical protein